MTISIIPFTIFVSVFAFPCTAILTPTNLENVPDYLKPQLLSIDEKNKIANLHYTWYGYSLKRLMAQLGKQLLDYLDPFKQSKSKELEASAKCLIYAKMKYERGKKLGYKRRVKRSYRLYEKRRKYKTASTYKLLDSKPKSVISRISNLLTTFLSNSTSQESEKRWMSTYRRMQKINLNIEKSRRSTLDTFNRRMYDLVISDEQQDEPPQFRPTHSLLTDGLHLIENLSDNSKPLMTHILSPRFAPLTPRHSKGILSPSIFPFYKDNVEQQILPIPDIIDNSGLQESDKKTVLSMVMELSRTRAIFDEALKMIPKINGIEKTKNAILSTTDKMSQDFEVLEQSLSSDQQSDIEKYGFSMLEISQMKQIFGNFGIDDVFNRTEMREYANYNREQRIESLWESIRNIAFGTYPAKHRVKRAGYTLKTATGFTIIGVLNPTLLTPYTFAPVYGLSVLGPVILSPNIFSPLILNPSVLSPWIFSPAVPLPFILSPYLLSPYIFSPLVMAPFILNPYVLSPNVFNPYVLSPLVLSPLVLCPDVFSPMTLGGAILSPSVLSPAVFSKSYVMANVLSPTFMS